MPARPRLAVLPLLAVIAVGLFLSVVQVFNYPRLSPVDELSHLDYMFRSPTVLEQGDKVEQQAMRTQACRGVDVEGFDPIPCPPGIVYDPDIYQEKGYNTAATNTPIYYTADRALAEVIRIATPVDNLFIAGRLAGAVWLALGIVLTWLAGRRLGIGRLPLGAVLGLLVASPAVTYPSATVTPDALGLAGGAAVLLTALRWEQRPTRGRAAALIATAVVVSLIKLTFFAVVPAVALYLLLHRSRSWESSGVTAFAEPGEPGTASVSASGRARTVVALATGAAALVAAFGWTLVSNARSHQDPNDLPSMATQFAVDAFPWRGLIDSAFSLAQPLLSPWVGVGDPTLMFFSTNVVTMVFTAGLLAAALFVTHGEREALLARCLLLAAVVFSLGLVVLGYVSSHIYFALPNRYGITLVAPIAVVTASLLRSRTSVAIVIGLAVLASLMSALRLLGLTGIPPT
ncbi:glycosyltransferase family 39 protein [Nocardioides zhouii]|uniref:Uncharacterized protein n=1 Tax=Nocardioides zhouii TaxID=1168729 RepID=A0A4Q2T898_9ACTN|nr:glycosyltransferase family 39 protein [Nocardioides zhouii]RYC13009.1 hypothetical protein EUA94_07240 [Nocardioides zhouii]